MSIDGTPGRGFGPSAFTCGPTVSAKEVGRHAAPDSAGDVAGAGVAVCCGQGREATAKE
jgi:hypothetical protein